MARNLLDERRELNRQPEAKLISRSSALTVTEVLESQIPLELDANLIKDTSAESIKAAFRRRGRSPVRLLSEVLDIIET